MLSPITEPAGCRTDRPRTRDLRRTDTVGYRPSWIQTQLDIARPVITRVMEHGGVKSASPQGLNPTWYSRSGGGCATLDCGVSCGGIRYQAGVYIVRVYGVGCIL